MQLFRAARARSILISHDLGAVCPLVDRVYVLERGALVQQVPAALCSCSLSLSLSLSLSRTADNACLTCTAARAGLACRTGGAARAPVPAPAGRAAGRAAERAAERAGGHWCATGASAQLRCELVNKTMKRRRTSAERGGRSLPVLLLLRRGHPRPAASHETFALPACGPGGGGPAPQLPRRLLHWALAAAAIKEDAAVALRDPEAEVLSAANERAALELVAGAAGTAQRPLSHWGAACS